MKKRVTGDIRVLNRRLLNVSRELEKEVHRHKVSRTPPGRIVAAWFRKAVNTFQGIEMLKSEGLVEEAWILLRVLLEAHVNLMYFLRGDPKEITLRYLDASMLDKLKHLREVNFYKDAPMAGAFNVKEWEQAEGEIKGRYSAAELTAIRKHGFSGKPFEQRAEAVGLKTMYQFCYRIASRSVHMFDPAETLLFEVAYRRRKGFGRGLLTARRVQLEANQNMLLGRLAHLMAIYVKSARGLEIVLIGVGYEKFRDGTGDLYLGREETMEPNEREEEEAGDFYVWRL
jgi:hypothetical protein